jgi:tRNA-Thr(GGU) m(6)t(6)A37 methyltransferase TsaA
MTLDSFDLRPIGVVVSGIKDPGDAPLQGDESDIESAIDLHEFARPAAADLRPGDRVVILTWLHLGDRDVLAVHPRGDLNRPLTGVFSTRSQDRPNPIGLHEVEIVALEPDRLRVRGLEAIDGTPVVDIKPVLEPRGAR